MSFSSFVCTVFLQLCCQKQYFLFHTRNIFPSSEADITVVSACPTASVSPSEPFAFMPENTSAAITAAAGTSLVQGIFGVFFFLLLFIFQIFFHSFLTLSSFLAASVRHCSSEISRPLPQTLLYVCGRGSRISVLAFGSTVKLFNCYHKFLCNSVAFHCDRCFTFFDSLYNTLAVYSCNFFIAACICNLACRCCFGSDGCCFTFFDRCRRFYKTECRILDNYFAGCLQGSCLCCNRNGSCFNSFTTPCFTVYGCNLCVAACVFYSCRWCCSCFYSCCFSFVDRYGSLCKFNCRSFYCYLAGCCGISYLCCDNCCSGFYAFNNTLAAYRCNLCVAGLKCYCCIAVICC